MKRLIFLCLFWTLTYCAGYWIGFHSAQISRCTEADFMKFWRAGVIITDKGEMRLRNMHFVLNQDENGTAITLMGGVQNAQISDICIQGGNPAMRIEP